MTVFDAFTRVFHREILRIANPVSVVAETAYEGIVKADVDVAAAVEHVVAGIASGECRQSCCRWLDLGCPEGIALRVPAAVRDAGREVDAHTRAQSPHSSRC